MSKNYIVSWNKIQKMVRVLAARLLRFNKWECILAVSRGGLVPSAIISRELGINYIDTVCISSYREDNTQGDIVLLKKPIIKKRNFLIVDDVVDSGRTASFIKKIYPKGYFVAIFAKPKSKHLVDDYILDIPQDVWIDQPLDTFNGSFINPIYKGNI